MVQVGFKLFAEGYGPAELVRQAVAAEQAGFDFVEISDHFHPWLENHRHSGFAWSILAAIAARTERIELATGVTCPTIRYHPAIIAQAAATTALLSNGRFTLGLGSGEQLNEHVVGRGWPPVHVRQEMLAEAVDIIRLLWSGGYHSYRGEHLQLEDARVFDLPDVAPDIAVAVGGSKAVALAASHGDAIFATQPDADLVDGYRAAGGTGSRYCEVPLAWAEDEKTGAASARELFRFGPMGWKVQAELPNPVNFEAATAFVQDEDMRQVFGCGPDPKRHLEVAGQFASAGFDKLALISAGPDVDGFLDFARDYLIEPIRALG